MLKKFSPPQSISKRASTWPSSQKILAYIFVVIVLAVASFSIGKTLGIASVKPLPPDPLPGPRFAPDPIRDPYPDLGHLLSMTPNQLQSVDIAVLNLDCAKGLPGAENLDIPKACKQLDEWAEHVRSETDRNFHLFTENPKQFEHSVSYFRTLTMITVLEQDMGVHYNMKRLLDGDYTHVNDVSISGLLGPERSGTCASMPVLYVAIGRRLGYQLKLVSARGHLFVRWDSGDGKVRFNIEATGSGLTCPADKFFTQWPYKLSDNEIKSGYFLRSMAPVEEFATFLTIRGNVLEELGLLPESHLAMAEAHALIPPHDKFFANLAVGVDKENLLISGKLNPKLPSNRFRKAKEQDYAPLPLDSVMGATVIYDEGASQ